MSSRNKEYVELLKHSFDENKFIDFVIDLLNLDTSDINADSSEKNVTINQYKDDIKKYKYVARYNDGYNNIGIFIVNLKSTKARNLQRNFVAKLLDTYSLDGSLVAFYSESDTSWRLSFVKRELNFTDKGIKESFTPAKRYSYLVGEHESVHTAQEFLFKLLEIDSRKITLNDIEEVFNVEKVTKRFFEDYKEKYLQLKEYLDKNEDFKTESEKCDFTSSEFAKKLMGQIVFLYFLQKKGWLGVELIPNELEVSEYRQLLSSNDSVLQNLITMFYELKDDKYVIDKNKIRQADVQDIINFSNIFVKTNYDKPWGSGKKDFIRSIFKQAKIEHKNFFDECLEPFFYKGLNEKRDNQYFPLFNCKIPFLNGGLFEPLNNYRWSSAHFDVPNDLFSNDKKDGILDFLDLYNFTIDEEEPLEKDVAVDPEMLGKIFENLLDVDDRKSKGAFYTPREIVYYMCQESLANYLVNKVGVDYNEIIEFIKYGDLISQIDWESSTNNQTDFIIGKSIYDNLLQIDKALIDVKVADPAVGSGAFPLGMLTEIVKIRNNISTYLLIQRDLGLINIDDLYNTEQGKRDMFDMKLQTIENCIYAVDIETSAIDIAKLRLWLSLIVDYPNTEEPKPLPNLDCKIMQGNSLIDEFEGVPLFSEKMLSNNLKKYRRNESQIESIGDIHLQQTLFDDTKNIEMYMETMLNLQKEYFITSDNKKKKELKEKIDKIQIDLVEESLKEDYKKLVKFREIFQKRQKPWFIWRLEFFDVFKNNGGFDIVIGNPPYGARFLPKEKDWLSKKFPHVADYESANYFIELGELIIKNNGILSFIIPNMFMANVNAKKFREYLLNNWNIYRVDNFSDDSIFESANVRNCIIYINKMTSWGKESLFTKMSYSYSLDIVKKELYKVNDLKEKIDNWLNILDENKDVAKLIKKIRNNSKPLSDIADICQGLIPYDKYRGHTEYQIKNKVWNSNYKKDDTYKKELRGKDVTRYSLQWNGNDWLSYGEWLAAPRKKEYFINPRILVREITNPRILATITEEEYYNTPSIINCIDFNIDIYYVLGILNSKLMTFYHFNSSPKAKKGMFPKILVADVRKIPIRIDKKYIDKLSELVKKQLNNYSEIVDSEIDKIVYKIYNINEEEKTMIDSIFDENL